MRLQPALSPMPGLPNRPRPWSRLVVPLLLAGLLAAALFAVLGALRPVPVAAQNGGPYLYTVSARDQFLRTIDPATGATLGGVMMRVPGFQIRNANGLAAHPTTGELYALLQFTESPGRSLVRVDPATGLGTLIGHTGRPFATLAFTADGTLYAITGENGPENGQEELHTLNLATGAPTFVMELGYGDDGEALAFNPDDGLLYHASGRFELNTADGKILETINPTTLVTAAITLTGPAALEEEITALLYAGSGQFYVTDIDTQWSRLTTDGALISVTAASMYHLPKGLAWSDVPPTAPPPCELAVMYGVANNDDTYPSLYTLDPRTGTAYLVAPLTGYTEIDGVEVGPDDALYAVGETFDNAADELLQIDPCTGAITSLDVITDTGAADVTALAVQPGTGHLYALETDLQQLLVFNPPTDTVASSVALSPTSGTPQGLAFAPDGTLYMTDDDLLYTLDPATGLTLTQVAITHTAFLTGTARIHGLDAHPVTGALIAVVWQEDTGGRAATYLMRLDPATGQLTLPRPTVISLETVAGVNRPERLFLPLIFR